MLLVILCTLGLMIGYYLADVAMKAPATVRMVRTQVTNNRIRRELGMQEQKITWR